MDILPDIDTVAVVVHGLNKVAIIEGMTLKQTVSSGGRGAYGIAADTVHNRLFVSNRDTSNVKVLRKSGSGWESAGINLTFDDRRVIFEVAFNPNNQKLYFVHVKPSGNWYVDIWQQQSDGTLVRLQKLPVDSSGRDDSPNVGGTGLEVDLATGNVFNANTKANTISVISGVTDQVVATTEAGQDPFMIAINPNTRTVFIGLRAVDRLQKLQDSY